MTRVDNETSGAAVCEHRHDWFADNVKIVSLEGLEHGHDSVFSVHLVPGSLSHNDTPGILRLLTKLVFKSMLPNLLHIRPVGDNTVDDGALYVEDI